MSPLGGQPIGFARTCNPWSMVKADDDTLERVGALMSNYPAGKRNRHRRRDRSRLIIQKKEAG